MSGILNALVGSFAPAATSFESIATINGTGSATSITFSSIPSTYKHLQLRFTIKDTENLGAHNTNGMTLTANSITSGYGKHEVYGNGTSVVGSESSASASSFNLGQFVPTTFTASVMAVGIIDILDYSLTTKYKTLRMLGGAEANVASTQFKVRLASALIPTTSAINSLTLAIGGGGNITSTSKFALYGIKG